MWGWESLCSKYKGDAQIVVFFLVLILSVIITYVIGQAIGSHQIVNIKQGVSLAYEIDDKGSGIASIMKARDSGKPIMEQMGMLFVKGYDKSKVTSNLERLFGAVYQNYQVDIFNGENNGANTVLEIKGGDLKEFSQADLIIPKPGAIPGNTYAVMRVKS